MDLSSLRTKFLPKIQALGYELYDLAWVQEGTQKILRLSIDNLDGITIDDCEAVNDVISPLLDELDPFNFEYYFEVSSPGAEKELRGDNQIDHAVGKFVHVETFEQILEGKLFETSPSTVTLQVKGKNTVINKMDIQKIRLAIKF